MIKDKILFLDIDGVLNSTSGVLYNRHINVRDEDDPSIGAENVLGWLAGDFSHDALANLHYIVSETKCKIVVSSTWRLGESVTTMKKWFKGIPLLEEAIIDKTDSLGIKYSKGKNSGNLTVCRGLEIAKWLAENGYRTYKSKNFVILDDDADMWPVMGNLVQTKSEDGLIHTKAVEAIEMLGGMHDK